MIYQNKIYNFFGTHYEMGFQQGEVFKENINNILNTFKDLEEIKGLKPRWLPTSLFISLAARKAYNSFKPIIEKYAPNQAERLKGIADGSGLNIKLIYLFSAAELLLGELDWKIPHLKTGCTSIAYKSSKTKSGHTIVSRNFDYAKFIVPFLFIKEDKPKDFFLNFSLTAIVLPGTFNGLNEHGVFIATNEAFPLNEKKEGLSASLIIQEALEKCENTEEVIKFFKKVPRGSGNVILIADPSDDIKILEYTSKRVLVREPYENDDFIVGTNHYTIKELKSIDIPREAIFGKKSPKCLRGVCINETSYVRKKTAEKKIRQKEKVDIEWIKSLQRDHSSDPKGKGGMETLCHHDPSNISAASMIIDLKTFESWFCFGLPCENEFIKFNFNKSK
ncbi:MAG: C45 family autoproteolytic acyltransferase/hydrolase [Promethearchaeota archaeon]